MLHEGRRQWLGQLVAVKWKGDDVVCGSTASEKRLPNHAPGFPQTLSVILGKSDWGKAFFFSGQANLLRHLGPLLSTCKTVKMVFWNR